MPKTIIVPHKPYYKVYAGRVIRVERQRWSNIDVDSHPIARYVRDNATGNKSPAKIAFEACKNANKTRTIRIGRQTKEVCPSKEFKPLLKAAMTEIVSEALGEKVAKKVEKAAKEK
jgi:hypothetical protein